MNVYLDLLILFTCLNFNNVKGFYYVKEYGELKDDKNENLIENFRIIYGLDDQMKILKNEFPDEFQVNFKEFDKEFNIKFRRNMVLLNDQLIKHSDDIYVIDQKTGQPIKYTPENSESYETYTQLNGDGFATLIRNRKYNSTNPFRLIGTIYSNEVKNLAFDIVPVVLNSNIKKRDTDEANIKILTYDSTNNHHTIIKRSISSTENEFQMCDTKKQSKNSNTNKSLKFKYLNSETQNKKQKQKRALNGQPVTLNLELLVVTDSTVYSDHQRFASTNDPNLVFLHMRVYLAHLINGVNLRYKNSLQNDADLRINILLSNFLFLTNSADQNWINPQLVGDPSYPTYNGKQVVVAGLTIAAFRDYMNSKTFTFNYDLAIGLFNKDIWGDINTQTPASRTAVQGRAYNIGAVCNDQRYAIAEEPGGFINVLVVAHEIGHNLGATHDGETADTQFCPAASSFIMTAIASVNNNNINLQKFSPCSINQFKNTLLRTPLYDAPSTLAQCLSNVPISLPIETSYASSVLPGQYWTADDQCKQIYGPTASFCQFSSSTMCVNLGCRPNATTSTCITSPNGAAEGTTCGSGKICVQGVCTNSPLAPVKNCPFGDDVVTQELVDFLNLQLPSPQLSCQQAFSFLTFNNASVSFMCSYLPFFSSACCQSCQKYTPSCTDKNLQCTLFSSFCSSPSIFQMCPVTCNLCTPQTCALCQNGALCSTDASSFFGVKCLCRPGFTGSLCEIATPCTPNPCLNGGTCQKLGSNGYVCQCTSSCTGYNCSTCISTSTISTSTTTTTTRTITTTTTTTTTATTTSSSTTTSRLTTTLTTSTTATVITSTSTSTTSTSTTSTSTIRATSTTIVVPNFPTTTNNNNTTTTPILVTCQSSPCKNNGTCLSLQGGSMIYCSCPKGFTGTFCELGINYCFPNPCLNGATCISGQPLPFSYLCQCSIGFSGQYCEIASNCSATSCLNGGTCSQISTNRFVCRCRCGFTGSNCETQSSPCSSSPCLNRGVCSSSFVNCSFSCSCPTGFQGARCEANSDPCLSNPCVNGNCSSLANFSSYACTCRRGFIGPRCEIQTSPCFSNPCKNAGLCISSGLFYSCLCLTAFSGSQCEIGSNNCISNPCQNGATCISNSQISQNVCLCTPGYTGSLCSILIDVCSSLPCQNNGTCTISSSSNFNCTCPNGYNGTFCENRINFCASSPCQNGGTCVNGANSYSCICPIGTNGSNCQSVVNPCLPNPCFNGGICTVEANNTAKCLCLPTYSGLFCETILELCSSNPCQNRGTCNQFTVNNISYYTCTCLPGYTGSNCQTILNVCQSNPCRNGGSCLQTQANLYVCICQPGYTDITCSTNINECLSNPCVNNGTCVDLINGFSCFCTPEYTGVNCSQLVDPCSSKPCINGVCSRITYNQYTCTCNPGYSGINCQTLVNACVFSPCKNQGTCIPFERFYTCRCPSGLTGRTCETIINNCLSSPCMNNGTCSQPTFNSFRCTCLTGFTGTRCDIRVSACVNYQCLNGGTCIQAVNVNAFQCLCPPGFTGQICQTNINECSSQPCQNGGTCVDGSNSYVCQCPQGLTGTKCDIISTTSNPLTTTAACIDMESSYCQSSTSILVQYCSNKEFYIRGYPLSTYCCKSCSFYSNGCFDSISNCPFLANNCNALASYNPHPCRKTCKIC